MKTRLGKPRILVLGAGTGVRASVNAARAAGFHVITADGSIAAGALELGDEQLMLTISDGDAVAAAARAIGVDGIIATTDYAVISAAVASGQLKLPGISREAAINATSKACMRRVWHEAGIPGPISTTASTDDALKLGLREIGLPVIVKPANALGGGSRGVSMARNEQEFEAAVVFARAYSADGILLVERCVEAISEHSLEILFANGVAHVIAIGDKVKSAPPYRVDLEVRYPSTLSSTAQKEVSAIAIRAARALGIDHGMAHVELAVTPDGIMLFELGARCGGGATAAPLVPWVTGIDEFVQACRVACAVPVHMATPTTMRGGCYSFIAPETGTVVSHASLDSIRRMTGVLEATIWAAEGSRVNSVRTGSDRIGSIVTGGSTLEEALSSARQAQAMLRITLSS